MGALPCSVMNGATYGEEGRQAGGTIITLLREEEGDEEEDAVFRGWVQTEA